MRTLNKNKTKLWLSNPTATTDKQVGGYYTGESIKTYGTATAIYLHLYPYNGEIVENTFGKDVSLDMVAVSNDVVLTKDSLLFLAQPSTNLDTTYDYRVGEISKSLNTYQYGLVRRT